MKTYIIDGNNLIGKIKSLSDIHKKDKQSSREKLIFLLERFFKNKKIKVYLHFDGFENEKLRFSKGNIIYSENQNADIKIKKQIESMSVDRYGAKSRKNLIIISSDNEIINFAKVCGCEIMLSENFEKLLQEKNIQDEEKSRINSISNDEIKKMFGL